MTLDLALRDNWVMLLSEAREVQYINGTSPLNQRYQFKPISPIYTVANSNILLVGTYSTRAMPWWYLGARIHQYLYVSPSLNSNFISGVQANDSKKARLNQLTLIEFKDYGVKPYSLMIEIPTWHENIYVEVWEYLDEVLSLEQMEQLNSIQAQLSDIEDKVNQLLSNP